MVLSLGRTLYNLTARRAGGGDDARPARPPGDLIWLHAAEVGCSRGLRQLALRLVEELGVTILLTCPDEVPLTANMLHQHPPADTPAEARAFLSHWAPALVIMAEGELRPAVLHEAEQRKLAVIMVDARAPYLMQGREGWYPGLIRTALRSIKQVLAVDEAAARAFRRAGAGEVAVAGRMEEPSAALSYHEPERAMLAGLMATRPVWLAVDVPAAEEAAVIAAHRSALRLAHRLLLILVPQDAGRAAELAAGMEAAEGWTVAQRALDQEPDTETEVYIPDSDAEYGLWYRLAPVSYMGGSLLGEGCARNPMEPAALGSAIVYGPRPGGYGSVFGRLGAAQAARAVGSAGDLGDALSDLLAPDRAARLAQAAWTLASDGVEVTDRVVDFARDVLDGRS
ncbi:3-deoxy-D-manno-octulosonic acid transferase [Cypionkella aquatica]|uniref:3-deoxy-D-manno-octulosonic acid transferase n=1 Tax=Cypionkella aquatica TaxID=1756042 RepID=A0AA37TY97_9RHOB|nr:glycosyltransferase N-terminal domain-containing protein [Cypionkella aquatica]GLS85381.1 3-deoxy-D-manno-octulosonic acid transferase [Cypionkella aquatica]